jgi:large subunit ribosomal protein L21
MYAVVKVGGQQFRVEKGDSIVVDRLPEDEGAKVALEPLLFADGKKAVFEGSDLEKVKVEAVVQGHERGRKVHVLKFKPKKGYKRRAGHRSELTRLEIGDIKVLTRKPATKKAGEDKAAEKEKPADKKKPAAKKPAAKRKQPAKKPAAKKPAARKKQEKKDGS